MARKRCIYPWSQSRPFEHCDREVVLDAEQRVRNGKRYVWRLGPAGIVQMLSFRREPADFERAFECCKLYLDGRTFAKKERDVMKLYGGVEAGGSKFVCAVATAPNAPPVAELFERALGVPIGFDTDVNASALAEARYGAA